MCTRTDPLLPLHRYRLTDSITELRQDSLAFTVEEVRELLVACGTPVSRDAAGVLAEFTEGWAAGLKLIAQSLPRGPQPAVALDAPVLDRAIADYLFDEVLADQPPQHQAFLLRTSVVEDLSPDLADHLTGGRDGRRTLAALLRAGAFITRTEGPDDTYRLHRLFRRLLQARLAAESPDEVADLHARCADWFAAAGRFDLAAEHAIAGGDWTRATELIVNAFGVAPLLARDERPWTRLIDCMPPDLPGDAATLLRIARAHTASAAVPDTDRRALAAVIENQSGAGPLRVQAAVAASAVAAAAAASEAESLEAVRLADGASQIIAANPVAVEQLSAVVLASRAAAIMKAYGGGPAVKAWRTALRASTATRSPWLKRTSVAGLALAEALQGRLDRAARLARLTEHLADQDGVPRCRRPASAPLALAWANCETLHLTEARRWATIAQESAPGYLDTVVDVLLRTVQARLLRCQHDSPTTAELLEDSTPKDFSPWLRERATIELAMLRLAAGDPQRARSSLEALPAPFSERASTLRIRTAAFDGCLESDPPQPVDSSDAALDLRVDAWIDCACVGLERGQTQVALAAVHRALELARPQQLRRPFIDSSPKLRRLLRTEPTLRGAVGWLRPATVITDGSLALRQLGSPGVMVAPGPGAPLTEREIEVLRLLSGLLTTQEIAATLFISINTVRTHIRSILRKLAVGRRNEAVRRARELALL